MPVPGTFFAPFLLYGLAAFLSIIVLYVVVSVAVERAPGLLIGCLVVGLAIAYFTFRP